MKPMLVVMPTYNERANLEKVVSGILAHDFTRVLVVDDGSPDGTGALADELARAHPGRLEVLHRTGPRGLGRSYIDGLRHAIAKGRGNGLLMCSAQSCCICANSDMACSVG